VTSLWSDPPAESRGDRTEARVVRVGVFGAAGRMGATVCRAVAGDPELELVAAVDPHHQGLDLRQVAGTDVSGVRVASSADAMVDAGVEVVVDFTHLDAARANLAFCAEHRLHAVVGTTGFTARDHDELRRSFTASNCVVAPNFAIGAVLMMRFAELAAPWFDTAEIVELHHEGKIDAPSGTAIATAERMAAASSTWLPDPTTELVADGARGASGPAGIPIHSIRMRGMVAHQEVILGTTGQTLSLRHDTTDRSSFMPGVLLACRRIAEHPGLTVGLDAFLGL
jgi:4-hydroxy-tetrahydrodipicolinate reductase